MALSINILTQHHNMQKVRELYSSYRNWDSWILHAVCLNNLNQLLPKESWFHERCTVLTKNTHFIVMSQC